MELLLLVVVALLALVGLPIGYVLIAASIVLIVLTTNTPLGVVPLRLFNGTDSFPMVAVPLFIFAGALMNWAGISHRLVELANSLVGFVRGGLAMTTTVSSMFFSEISGSAVADAAALGSVLIPAMKQRGLSGALCRGGALFLRDHRHHHPALDPHDSLRGDLGLFHRQAVPGGRGSRDPVRRGYHVDKLLAGAARWIRRVRAF